MRKLFDMIRLDYDPEGVPFVRPSVRGIILRDHTVAMVYSRKYDYYKFPGGGIEPGESHEECLIREVAEESGLQVIPGSLRPYGEVHRVEAGDRGGIFIQDNYYYLCRIRQTPGQQCLDDYEREEGYILRYVTAEEAIFVNRFHAHGGTDQTMLEREAKVLELLKEEGCFK